MPAGLEFDCAPATRRAHGDTYTYCIFKGFKSEHRGRWVLEIRETTLLPGDVKYGDPDRIRHTRYYDDPDTAVRVATVFESLGDDYPDADRFVTAHAVICPPDAVTPHPGEPTLRTRIDAIATHVLDYYATWTGPGNDPLHLDIDHEVMSYVLPVLTYLARTGATPATDREIGLVIIAALGPVLEARALPAWPV